MLRPLAFSLLCAVACAPARDHAGEPPIEVFGDDAVADALGRDPARAPRTFAEHEALFGVGRACASRRTFTIEETSTRFAEIMVGLGRVAPRVVVAGCGDAAAAPYSTFTVMPTDPARDPRDPLARGPIEVMALDRATGAYSFYVFDDEGVQRIERDAYDRVFTVRARRVAGADGRRVERVESGRRCYGCHVQGGPIMASLASPWTSWVSEAQPAPLGAYEGETASLLRASAGADELEPIVKNGLRVMVSGLPGRPGSGLGPRTLAGKEPGGLRSLLRSVFCETELQWASAGDTAPLQLFLDPSAAAGAELQRPPTRDGFPRLLPVRSEVDQRVEEWLVQKKLLSLETVRVIRLLDDRRDVFSSERCGLLAAVSLPDRPEALDAVVRAALAPALAGLPARTAAYARALLGEGDLAAARDAYFAELRARLALGAEKLVGDRAELDAFLVERRVAARRMFPSESHPLPASAVP